MDFRKCKQIFEEIRKFNDLPFKELGATHVFLTPERQNFPEKARYPAGSDILCPIQTH